MTFCIRRREFIAALGGAAVWPLAAVAQQGVPVIGYLDSGAAEPDANMMAAFRKGLSEMGYVEGRNVAIEYRGAEQRNRLDALAAEFVSRRVAVINAVAGAAWPAQAATRTIPIVFLSGVDPVKGGLVASLNKPGGNLTGVTSFSVLLNTKRLQILRELVPSAAVIGVLIDRTAPLYEDVTMEMQAAARDVGQAIMILPATTEGEIDAAFATAAQHRVSALVVLASVILRRRRDQIVPLAARYRIPVSYGTRESVDGGLMSYNPDVLGAYRRAGLHYVGQILKGAKASDLPVELPTKFELVINLKTAKALGLAVPRTLLALADEVIE
jgi:putative tryptophan/tyrosine transport system substrate-binding protein